jgi:hypothetical protein
MSPPVHTAVGVESGGSGDLGRDAHLPVAGSYEAPCPCSPPHTIIDLPVQTAANVPPGRTGASPMLLQMSKAGSYAAPSAKAGASTLSESVAPPHTIISRPVQTATWPALGPRVDGGSDLHRFEPGR